jgi:acylphosphatase
MTELRRYRIFGRVQGVGFRAFVWQAAGSLGVAGWVRNRYDGSVEALMAATPDDHEKVLGFLEQGPRMSRVDRVEVLPAPEILEAPDRFEVLPDA